MGDISIVELLQPNLLKTTTAMLLRVLRTGGDVKIRVESHRPLFVVSDAQTQPIDIDSAKITEIWEMDALKLFKDDLAQVVEAGFGEVTFSLKITKEISHYPEKKNQYT